MYYCRLGYSANFFNLSIKIRKYEPTLLNLIVSRVLEATIVDYVLKYKLQVSQSQ